MYMREFKIWLFYNGPLLLKEKAHNYIFNRFSNLSYTVGLLMTSEKYTTEAVEMIRVLFNKTEKEYTIAVGSLNVHSLCYLTRIKDNFGQLWSCFTKTQKLCDTEN